MFILEEWLYVFAPVIPMLPPCATDFCLSNNFRATFHISFILAELMAKIIVKSINLRKIWSECHETKKQTLNVRFKCGHQFWPLPWSWPFYVMFLTSHISRMGQPLAMKKNPWVHCKTSDVFVNFDLGHILDLDIFKVKSLAHIRNG